MFEVRCKFIISTIESLERIKFNDSGNKKSIQILQFIGKQKEGIEGDLFALLGSTSIINNESTQTNQNKGYALDKITEYNEQLDTSSEIEEIINSICTN
jgi:hypothetical protein